MSDCGKKLICAWCTKEIRPGEPKVPEFDIDDGNYLHLHCANERDDGDALAAEHGW